MVVPTQAQYISQQVQVSATPNLTEQERLWIIQNPIIRATNYTGWAPIDFFDAGKPTGLSVDYLNLVVQKVGLNVEYISDPNLPNLVKQLQDREIDVAHGLIKTSAREDFLDFTSTYLDLPFYFFGRTGDEPIQSLDDLVGRRIGVINGIASANVIKNNYSHLELVEQSTVLEAFRSLSTGEIDVFAVILPIANYTITKNFIAGVDVIGENVFPELAVGNKIRLATRNDLPILNSILEKGMAAVTDFEFQELSRKWQAQYYSKNRIGLNVEEAKWLRENHIIKVAADPTIAPLEFIDQFGQITGISGTYLKIIEDKLGVRFQWIASENFEAGINKVISGDADMLSAVVDTPERREFLNFSDQYVSLAKAIFTREGNQIYGSMDGLYGRKIAQIKGFPTMTHIRQDYPDMEIIEVETISEALKLLVTGAVDAYIGDVITTSYYIAEEGLTQIIVVGEAPYSTVLSMGVRKELPYLSSALQKAMQSITSSERAKISQDWLSLRIVNNHDNTAIWQISGIALFTILLILVWAISLRREIAQRRLIEKELRISRANAQIANDAKSSFLANMSHEIRTPLNAIIGFSDVMSSGVFGEINIPKYKEYLRDIKGSGEHLATVIKDILDLSKIESGNWQLNENEFDLNVCIKDSLKMLRRQAKDKEIELSYSPLKDNHPLMILGDVNAYRRIIINLLSNSVKFTKNGGEVGCLVVAKDNGSIELEIKDNGIGIPEDRLDYVISPFGQNHDDEQPKEVGTGLGLSIVKQLVELHRNTFKLESELGVGTSAFINIPNFKVI